MDNSKLKKRNLSQEDLFNLSELFKLMKPRVMSLVIFTCAVGLLTAPNLVSTKDAIIGIFVSLAAGLALMGSSRPVFALLGVGLILVLSLPFLLFAFVTTLINHIKIETIN